MITIITMSTVPAGLKGYMTRFLTAITSQLYVGDCTPRVADALWTRMCEHRGHGVITMVTCDHTREQGFRIRREGGDRIHTTDMDGMTLMGIDPKPRKEDRHGDDDNDGMNDRRGEHPSNMYWRKMKTRRTIRAFMKTGRHGRDEPEDM